MSYEWSLTACSLLSLASFTQLNAFENYSCYFVYQLFLFIAIIPLNGDLSIPPQLTDI